MALAARARWPGVHITGTASRRAPLPAGMLDRTVVDATDLADCELIILGMPVPAMPDVMAALVRRGTNAVVTDVGSTKRSVMTAAAASAIASFIGGHPMAGGERPGAAQARADLFVDKPWLLVEGSADAATSVQLEAFIRAVGAVPRWMSAEDHDRAVAYVSHLPQVVAAALMNAADAGVRDTGPHVAGNAFAEMTRLASSPGVMWRDICADNADFVAEALKAFLDQLPRAAASNTGEWIDDALARSGDARRRWRATRVQSDSKP